MRVVGARTYLERLEAAYQGEIYGESMYRLIAAAQAEPEHAWKWRVLAQQETELKYALRARVAAHRGDTRELEESVAQGARDGRHYAALDWTLLMERFRVELAEDIAEYADLEHDCPADDAATLRRLTEHEVLTREFCELELSGRADISIQRILDGLESPPSHC